MKFLYALILLLFVGVGYGQNKKLAIIGSSTSACTGPSSFATCYVGRLDAYYDGIGQPIDIFQLAVGGYNVYRGMPSSYPPPVIGTVNTTPDPNNNITKALSLNPDVILVNYPTNDYDQIPIDSVMHALRTIRDSARVQGKHAFITTTQPRHGFPFNTMANRTKLKVLRDSIMNAFGFYAIDFWTGLADPTTYEILPAYDAGDHIHLNDAGHDILFQRVRDKNIFAAALPVKLKAFAAKLQQDKVTITFTVTEESAGTTYQVERSQDGLSYQTIHTIKGNGSAGVRNYQFVDQSAIGNVYYYRLQITEAGKTSYSQVIKVFSSKNKFSIKSFFIDPSGKLSVKLSAPEGIQVQFKFVNSSGALVHKSTQLLQAGDNQLYFSMNGLSAGAYWAECYSDQERIFVKGFRVE